MTTAIDWTECEELVESELRYFLRNQRPEHDGLFALDREDLLQEGRLAYCRAAEKVDRSRHGARTYLRTAIGNRFDRVFRRQQTLSRCPHDENGRPRPMNACYEIEQAWDLAVDKSSPEDTVRAREGVTYLRDRLDPRDWAELMSAFVEGARIATGRNDGRRPFSLVRAHAQSILTRIGYRVRREQEDDHMSVATIPKPDPEDLPECHADGESPIGYDVEDYDCVQCRDKFTCLPRAIETGLQDIELTADLEVAAVHGEHLTFEQALQRMLRRLHKEKAGEEIDPEEGHLYEGLVPAEALTKKTQAAEPEPEPEPEPEEGPEPGGKRELALRVLNAEIAKQTVSKPAKPAAKKKDPPRAKPAAKKTAPKKDPPKAAKKAAKKTAKKAAKKAERPELTVEARGPKKFLVFVDGTKKGRIEEDEDGWGWWSRAEESPEWLTSYSKALTGIAAHLREKHPKLKIAKEARGAHKAALEAAKGDDAPKVHPRKAPEDWPRMRDERPYPSPKELTADEMAEKLAEAQAKLGVNIELDYGMQLVRRTRKGEVVARITKRGFEYDIPHGDLVKAAGFDSPTQVFGSLSAVAMWFEGRLRTGNDFFNISKHACTEVRSKDHRIIDRKGGAPGA